MDIDFTNWKQLYELMDNADKYDDMWLGRNDDDELVGVSIFTDKVVVSTYQHNNWIRKNIYERDFTVSEMYER